MITLSDQILTLPRQNYWIQRPSIKNGIKITECGNAEHIHLKLY